MLLQKSVSNIHGVSEICLSHRRSGKRLRDLCSSMPLFAPTMHSILPTSLILKKSIILGLWDGLAVCWHVHAFAVAWQRLCKHATTAMNTDLTLEELMNGVVFVAFCSTQKEGSNNFIPSAVLVEEVIFKTMQTCRREQIYGHGPKTTRNWDWLC
jgi:hypothetical protein